MDRRRRRRLMRLGFVFFLKLRLPREDTIPVERWTMPSKIRFVIIISNSSIKSQSSEAQSPWLSG